MAVVRFGIIGCSSIARRRFLPALAMTQSATLQRIGSRTPERAREFGALSDCLHTGSYEEVLADSEVDAVYISTPAAQHEEWIIKAAEAGKHVLCEKPALMNLATAQACVDVCRKAGVRLMEAYSFRYHPQHALIRKLLTEGRIGESRFFQAQFTFPRPKEGDIRLRQETGGGVFLDAAGYPMAAAMMMFDALPLSVYSVLGFDEGTGVDDAVSMLTEFPGSKTAVMNVGYGLHYQSWYSILGSEGRIQTHRAFSVWPDRPVNITVETEKETETLSSGPVDQFQLMIEDFCKSVSEGQRDFSHEEQLIQQHRVMEAAHESYRQKRPITISGDSK